MPETIRLNKYIARAGICSRRKADELIAAGRVRVDGETVTEMGVRVAPESDVEVDGRSISRADRAYYLMNKPDGVVTTAEDQHGRRTVLDLLPVKDARSQALFPVGRLDMDTVGLLLITNDGELAHRLMHPSYEVQKLYLVRTRDEVQPHELDELRRGVELEDGPAKADEAMYINGKDEIGLELHEGRNRQVRRMIAALGNEVTYLERVAYAGLRPGALDPGEVRRLSEREVNALRRQVGLAPVRLTS